MNKAYLEAHEVQRLEQAANYMRDRLLIRLLFHLGCRISEALSLDVKDIDFDTGTVAIQQLKLRIKLTCNQCGARLGKSHSFCPKCGATVKEAVAKEQEHRRMRTLPLDENTLKILKDYVGRCGPVSRGSKTLLFGITRGHAWKIISNLAEKAGLGKLVNPTTGTIHNISPHRLRDAFAVHAVKVDDSGDGLRLLQEHLGHQSITTTMRYRKISGDEQREWFSKLWNKGKDSDDVTS